jgi:aryl-alcohol dehydrogenase-like predicted oxidoreductase
LEKRPFGKTDMQVSALGFGSYKMSGKPGGATVSEVSHLLGPALDAGMNVIDTAECYGQAEELIGQAVSHRRSDYYLFTKCGHTSGCPIPGILVLPHLACSTIALLLRKEKQKEHMFSSGAFPCLQCPFPCQASR